MKPTKKQTASALEKSIRHWRRLATGKRKLKEGYHYQDCALCALFLDQASNHCDGCPVKEETGQHACRGTPWREVDFSFVRSGYDYNTELFKKSATRMLEFLIGLRKKK